MWQEGASGFLYNGGGGYSFFREMGISVLYFLLNWHTRYLVVLYYNAVKQQKKLDAQKAKEELQVIRQKLGLDKEDQ